VCFVFVLRKQEVCMCVGIGLWVDEWEKEFLIKVWVCCKQVI
jgi:hypothetical protein